MTDTVDTSYWSGNGKHQDEYNELVKLMPMSGACDTWKGEVIRAVSKIGHDLYNNGFGNSWEPVAQFLINEVPTLPAEVTNMFRCHAAGIIASDNGNYYEEMQQVVEQMINVVLDYLRDKEDYKNYKDMWDTNFSEHNFEQLDEDDYYDYSDDDEDEYACY